MATTEATRTPAEAARAKSAQSFRHHGTRFALPGILVLLWLFFSVVEPETFATSGNAQAIIANNAVISMAAVALVIPLTVGKFDLSVGANLGLGAILVTGLTAKSGMELGPAVVVAILGCAAVGLFNGLMVAVVGVNSLIVTLATSTILAGGVTWYADGKVIYEGIPEGLSKITGGDLMGIPLPGVYLIVTAAIAWYVLTQTPLGRYMYAVGGSQEAAKLSGLNVTRLTVAAFVWGGVLVGIAGVVQASLLGSGSPTVGPSFLLPAFAGAFLGATAIRVGTFNVIGTVVAVFTIAVGSTGLQLMGAPFYVQPIFQGVALLVAVTTVRLLRRQVI